MNDDMPVQGPCPDLQRLHCDVRDVFGLLQAKPVSISFLVRIAAGPSQAHVIAEIERLLPSDRKKLELMLARSPANDT